MQQPLPNSTSTQGGGAGGVAPSIVIAGCNVSIPENDFKKIIQVLDTPTGDNLKRELLSKFYPQLFGNVTIPSLRPQERTFEKGGDGLGSATCGHAAIEGGIRPTTSRKAA